MRRTLCFIAAALAATALATPTVGDAAHPDAPTCPSYRSNDQYPIRLCDKGDDVTSIQGRLRSFGFSVTVDGYFGPATERAVREFQRLNGRTIDGLVGPRTWSALGAGSNGIDVDGSGLVDPDESTYLPATPAPRCDRYTNDASYPLDRCDKGAAVLVAQAFLWAFEHNLEIDGYFGPATDDAVRNYQATAGLAIDGLIGRRTWRELTSGFTCGSDTDHSGVIDPDEVELSPQDFADFYRFLIACSGSRTSTQG